MNAVRVLIVATFLIGISSLTQGYYERQDYRHLQVEIDAIAAINAKLEAGLNQEPAGLHFYPPEEK